MYPPYDSQNNSFPKSPSAAEQSKDEATSQQAPQTPQTAQAAQGQTPTAYPYTPAQSYYTQPARPAQNAYTWGGQQPGYYGQAQPQEAPLKPKKEKKPKGRFALKLTAAALCCAVVSLSSVGVFAGLIQNGVVDVQSPEGSQTTAAFTLFKQEGSKQATPTVQGQAMTTQEVAQKLIPSVVCVQNYQINQQGFLFGGIEYVPSQDSEVSPAGEGSGIIFSKDGYIVTNQHVVDGATSIKVVTSDGMTYEATLVGEDTQTDLAVLKIDTDDELTPAEFGSSSDLQVTDPVMAIGNPGGMQFNSSVTMGYISGLNRQITNGDTGFVMECIQTDAAINPGNSGGALVDMNGHVVGINSSKIAATEYEGLGFAIPSDTVQPVVSDLIEYGYVKDRAMLGISGRYLDRTAAMWYGLSSGYYVNEIRTEKANASGLKTGDVITAIDGTQITSASTISTYLAQKKPGETVTLTVNRALSGEEGLEVELALSDNSGVRTESKPN